MNTKRYLFPLVFTLAVLILAGAACAVPLASAPVPTATLPAPAPSLTPRPATPTAALAEATATLVPTLAPETSEVQIYLVALGDNGATGKAVGCGDSLVPVRQSIQPTRQPIAAALGALFAIKQQNYGQSGLYNALWQADLRVDSAEIDSTGLAIVNLSGQPRMGGECDIPRFKGQIEQTILGVGGVRRADIFLNDKPIDQALSLK